MRPERAALCIGLLFLTCSALAATTRPNIVFILADDLGWGDLASYGHPYAKTPNLDRLASEGTQFQQFYVAGPSCAPSRASFMTGKHPANLERYPSEGFESEATLTELLSREGYSVGHFGKWHIGPNENIRPGVYGIDQPMKIGPSRYDIGGRDAKLFKAAIKFIKDNKEAPFYVNIWSHIAHNPVVPRAEHVQLFQDLDFQREDFSPAMQEVFDLNKALGWPVDESMINYLAELYALDSQVGLLLDSLDSQDLARNTIVIFSNDNGPGRASNYLKHKFSGTDAVNYQTLRNLLGSTGNLRGAKGEQYEGGIRSPFIARWPGRIPAGEVNESSVMSSLDFFPTLAGLIDVELGGLELDGENNRDIWLGSTRSRKNPLFWTVHRSKPTQALRSGDWKLLLRYSDNSEELYNLNSDPEESENLALQHPEIVSEMKRQLNQRLASFSNQRKKQDENWYQAISDFFR